MYFWSNKYSLGDGAGRYDLKSKPQLIDHFTSITIIEGKHSLATLLGTPC